MASSNSLEAYQFIDIPKLLASHKQLKIKLIDISNKLNDIKNQKFKLECATENLIKLLYDNLDLVTEDRESTTLDALNKVMLDFEATLGYTGLSDQIKNQNQVVIENSLLKKRIDELVADQLAKEKIMQDQVDSIYDLEQEIIQMQEQHILDRDSATKMKEYNVIIQENLAKERADIEKEREQWKKERQVLHDHVASLRNVCFKQVPYEKNVQIYKICDDSLRILDEAERKFQAAEKIRIQRAQKPIISQVQIIRVAHKGVPQVPQVPPAPSKNHGGYYQYRRYP